MNVTDLVDADATDRYLDDVLLRDIEPAAIEHARALVTDALGFERPPAGAHVLAARLAELDGDAVAFATATAAALDVDPHFAPAHDDQSFLELLRHGAGHNAGARRRALHLMEKLEAYCGRPTEVDAQLAIAARIIGGDALEHASSTLLLTSTDLFLALFAFELGMLQRFASRWAPILPPVERALVESWCGARHRYLRLVRCTGRRARFVDLVTDEVLDADAPVSPGWEPGEPGFALLVPVGGRLALIGEPMLVLPGLVEDADAAIAQLQQDPSAVADACLRWLLAEQLHDAIEDFDARVRFVFPDVDPRTLAWDEESLLARVEARKPAAPEYEQLLDAIVAHRIISLRTPHTWAIAERLLAMGAPRDDALEAVTRATEAELWARHAEEAA